MEDQDRRWPVKSRDGESRSWSDMAGKWMPQGKPTPHEWGYVDVDAPAPPLPDKWKGWLGSKS